MKQLWIFFCLLLGFIVYGCDSQPIPVSPIGNLGNIQSRNMIFQTVLDAGSKALFNASGGLAFTNEVFVFTGSQWENTNVSLSPDNSTTTNLTALYPAYNNEQDDTNEQDYILITSNPYSNNALTDVLVAKSTFTNESEISLEFKHLFAKLTFYVASSLEDKINQIVVTAPKVTAINGMDGSFIVSTDENHSTLLSKDESGAYSCIIPAIENCNLTIIINPGENEIRHPLTHNFESGKKYECTITQTDTRPGIRTAEDLIDFSRLINGKNSIYGKSLSDFGETVNGRTTYKLLADIDFENIQSSTLFPIGYNDSKPFVDVFDGQGHVIYNLTIPDKSTNSTLYTHISSLFGCIGENGIVKNLHIYNAKTISSPSCNNVGGIATQNHGLIENCSVRNSSLNKVAKVGGICGTLSSTGYIINCYTANNVFEGNETGGIAGNIAGRVLNCFVYSNNFLNTKNGTFNGGISGQSNKGQIHNCYIYQPTIPSYWGAVLGKSSNTTMRKFYYNNCTYFVYEGGHSTSSNAIKYNENFKVDGTHISVLLNDWITTTGQTEYPNLTFRTWKVAENGSACFQ